jgi:hypothetical protein
MWWHLPPKKKSLVTNVFVKRELAIEYFVFKKLCHTFWQLFPKKKLCPRGSIVFTTFISRSLCPIVFLEIIWVWVFQCDEPMKCDHYKRKKILCAIHHLPKSNTQSTDLAMKMQPQISMFKPSRSMSWCEWRLVLTSSFPTLNLNTIESPRV